MAQSVDVIVLGGGIVGASTAYALVKQGYSVRLVDQYEVGHKRGSSHGDGRVVRFNYTEAIYVEMAMQAYQAWDTLSTAADEKLLHTTGLIEYAPVGDEAITVTERILKQYDIAYERLSTQVANERFPQYNFDKEGDILFQPGGAVACATPAVKALWRLFIEAGGIAQTNTRIKAMDVQAEQITLTTESGEILQSAQLVLAAGGWTKQFAAQLGLDLPLDVTQEILAYFPPKSDVVNHHVGTMPVMLDHFKIPDTDAQFYSLPMIDVQGVKMGWHHSGVDMNPDDERRIVPEIVSELQAWVDRRYPHLQNEPMQIDTCLYTNTPDYHFILDKHPQYDNVTIGAGFSGHGFKFGPLLGELLASLVTQQTPSISLDTFALARFSNPEKLDKRIGA